MKYTFELKLSFEMDEELEGDFDIFEALTDKTFKVSIEKATMITKNDNNNLIEMEDMTTEMNEVIEEVLEKKKQEMV